VRIGVLENSNTLLANHYAFHSGPASRAWFDIVDGALTPRAETPVDAPLSLEALPFSPQAHHATHVAALLAGRAGPCWSGLLPSARLVLIDLRRNQSQMYQDVQDAVGKKVLVYNVSQTWNDGQNTLHTAVKDEAQALWVVAAGNEDMQFGDDDVGAVPAFARWSRYGNVIAVTAADRNGGLLFLGDRGVNRGRRFVDLIALGHELYSATEVSGFARASGTSQATPQVAAAAALLVDPLGAGLSPGDAKARLIATARWSSSYAPDVWGGRLDFAAAVRNHGVNVLRTATDVQRFRSHAVRFNNDPEIRIVSPGRFFDRSDTGRKAPKEVPFSSILSMRRNPVSGFYRVVLKHPEDGSLGILLDAELADGAERLRCEYTLLDGTPPAGNECGAGGLSVVAIDTYIRGGPYGIDWSATP
jgi:subtilisin family serine protease